MNSYPASEDDHAEAKWAIASTPFVTIVTAAASARRPGARAVPVTAGGHGEWLWAGLAPTVIRLGAEDSTVGFAFDGRIGRNGVATVPAAGRYAIFGFEEAPREPDCRVTGGGLAGRRAEALTVRPADYEGDATSLMWVATFTTPGPGTYEITCAGDWAHTVGAASEVDGAVGSLIHWPLVLILLLGALPGVAIVADTAHLRHGWR